MRSLFGVPLALAATLAHAVTINASVSTQIEDQGGYTYNYNYKYFDPGVTSASGTTYKSFGVLDFSATGLSGQSITGATLTFGNTYAPTAGAKAAGLSFYAVTDTQTSLASGQTTVGYDDAVTGGYSGQLGTATLLGTLAYVPDPNTNDRYVVSLAQNPSALTRQIGSGTLRIIVVTDEMGKPTFAGVGSAATPSTFVPSLDLTTQPVPEPSAFAALGLGALALVRRRRSAK